MILRLMLSSSFRSLIALYRATSTRDLVAINLTMDVCRPVAQELQPEVRSALVTFPRLRIAVSRYNDVGSTVKDIHCWTCCSDADNAAKKISPILISTR